jgi:hypothetical protein
MPRNGIPVLLVLIVLSTFFVPTASGESLLSVGTLGLRITLPVLPTLPVLEEEPDSILELIDLSDVPLLPEIIDGPSGPLIPYDPDPPVIKDVPTPIGNTPRVPEPATVWMLVAGLAAVAVRRGVRDHHS